LLRSTALCVIGFFSLFLDEVEAVLSEEDAFRTLFL
jgi:hypothetical protein